MKTIRKFMISVMAGTAALCATSCLEDTPLVDWDDLGVVIELPYNSHYLAAQEVEPGETLTFDLMVNYTVSEVSMVTEDIPVTLDVDLSMVDEYNKTSTTQYECFPEGTYDFPLTLTIKKGSRLAEQTMTVNVGDEFEPGHAYMLPLVIANVPEGYIASGNFGHLYLRILMK